MPPPEFLEVQPTEDGNVVRLLLRTLDTDTGPLLRDELVRLVKETGRAKVRLDLGAVESLTAGGLGQLVTLHIDLHNQGGELTLVNPQPQVHELFRATRLTQVLDIRLAAGKCLLVVEDDALTSYTLKRVLEREGYTVTCAADGREALERLRQGAQKPPALILLDLVMDGMDGWAFRDHQQQDPSLAQIPVIVVSGTADVPASAASLGAVAYLEKPLEFDQLLETIRSKAE
jgi:anti-anti-sigma factor